jgi:serine/threonine protein phosphatase PrpC
MGTQAVEFASQTDVGQKRQRNEDNFLVDKKLSLFVVCDGMGGHAGGDVASALAVRTVHDEVKKEGTQRSQDEQARNPEHARVRRQSCEPPRSR